MTIMSDMEKAGPVQYNQPLVRATEHPSPSDQRHSGCYEPIRRGDPGSSTVRVLTKMAIDLI